MTLLESITLFSILVALAALPSSSVTLVVVRAATLGVANGVAVAVGIVVGDLVFVALAVLGLSVVAEKMGALFFIIKILGGCYLIWLGLSLLRSKGATLHKMEVPAAEVRNLVTSFLAGFVLTLGDVKAILFYVSLFPMFVDLATLTSSDIAIIVTVTILSVGSVKIVYAILASKIVQHSYNAVWRQATQKVAGGLMVGAGSYLVIKA